MEQYIPGSARQSTYVAQFKSKLKTHLLSLYYDRIAKLVLTSPVICDVIDRDLSSAGVCFSVSHAGCDSPSSAKFDPEPNRLLQCRICQLATTQHHSAPGSH